VSRRLFAAGDPQPAAVLNAGADSPFLIVCDHAGRRVPGGLADLGLPPEEFDRHIAWDVGAEGVAVKLAQKLAAPAIRQRYSRLVIDCNRAPDKPDSIVEVSDGTAVPANHNLSEANRAERLALVHKPYHDAIAAELDARAARRLKTAMVAIHSFTPVMRSFERPWLMGVLHLHDSPFSDAVLAELRALSHLNCGDNEPYKMDGTDYTIPFHAIRRGLPYVELEIRQDLIADEAGQEAYAALLAEVLPRALDAVR
jgi:predicted N-formylglutamate amidohydrolase